LHDAALIKRTYGIAETTFLLPTCHKYMHRAPPPPTIQLPPSSASIAPTHPLDAPDPEAEAASSSPCRDLVSHSLTCILTQIFSSTFMCVKPPELDYHDDKNHEIIAYFKIEIHMHYILHSNALNFPVDSILTTIKRSF
jgi:hypothetical protein